MATNTWHKEKKSWKKINEFLFKNSTMADCSFLITVENTVVKIPAHKYVLGGYSPEFYNLFYLLKSDSDEIPIDDVCGESFLKFLEFVYTETTELTLDNIEVLMQLAVRYSVESFKDFCVDFLMKSITGENVLCLMDKFSIYGLHNFELKCFKIINSNRLIFDDPSFYEISNKTLTNIVKSEELKGFKEITIFKGVDKWSEVFCNKNNKKITSSNKRMALGAALKCIRFGAMSSDEFSSCTLKNPVLTSIETIQVFQFISTNGKLKCPYSGEKRMKMTRQLIPRIRPKHGTAEHLSNGYNMYCFTVQKPLQFHGFTIFGRFDSLNKQNAENFIIQLKDTVTHDVLLNDAVEVYHDGTGKEYDLLFKNSKLLEYKKSYYLYIKRLETVNYNSKDAKRKKTTNVDDMDSSSYPYVSALLYEECHFLN